MRLVLLAFLIVSITGCSGSRSAVESGPTGTVIVANMADNTVMLLDASSGEIIRTVESGPAPHEVAVSPDGQTAVITNYGNRSARGNTLTVLAINGDEEPRIIDLGIYERPHGIVYLSDGETVAVTSEVQSAVLFVDVASGEIENTASTEQRASHMVAADASATSLYTTNIVAGSITRIDAASRSHDRVMTVGPMIEGVAVDPAGNEIWVGANNDGKVLVVEAATGDSLHALEDFGFPYRMSFTADGSTILISDPMKGEVRIVEAASREELHTVTFDESAIVETAEIPGSTSPEGIINDRDNKYAYVSMQGLNKVACIEVSTGEVLKYYDVGVWPDGINYSKLVIR